MSDDNKISGNVPDEKDSGEPSHIEKLRKISAAYSSNVIAENAAQKDKRNARRWKSERDPVEYEKQKLDQKTEYAEEILATEGRAVRAYVKVPGKTRDERETNRRERDAERKAKSRANATQARKDRDADRKWSKRKLDAGWTPEQIAEGLALLKSDRRFRSGSYEENPLYGAF